ncbi:hypothetical protein Q4519_07020 [Motilimonas sp. 1_MG-2023]|uniref:hypothetical protein n=1 Tax=Motilimonas sp. 1_MG-2023 TaxID=3062672 RepID=UPI0026E26428|nr:hypothetical protein [Motilimonas sp. 1_MG-2023]MDO6525433.1 hypothetical protein [Motilimonas sp. 1_MG-2023]
MKHVTACYIDAADGRPATEAPLRHGPKLPHEQLVVDAVDHRQTPPLIIGRMPIDVPINSAMKLISDEYHLSLLDDYNSWREQLAIAHLEADQVRTEQARREAYRVRVDPLVNESILKRAMGETQAADDMLTLALTEREAIQTENPWPAG